MQYLMLVIALYVFPWMLIWAALSDIRSMTISNTHNLIFLLLFFAISPLLFKTQIDLTSHILCFAVTFAVGFLFFIRGWMGGGDVKIITVISLWYGAHDFIDFILYMAIWGGILTLLFLILRQYIFPNYLMQTKWFSKLHRADSGIPYGVAIALAALETWTSTNLFKILLTLYS